VPIIEFKDINLIIIEDHNKSIPPNVNLDQKIHNEYTNPNCHNLFLDFNENISLANSKRDSLKKSRKALRAQIKNYFKKNHPQYVPKFFIQGSNKMEIAIRTYDDTCDLDEAVYFLREPNVSPTTIQKWVLNAISENTVGRQEHRKKCIRVIYPRDYHIDFSIYYKKKSDKHPHLAVKNSDWEQSDPKEFMDWFNKQKDNKGQLIRIIKYLKAWCDRRARSAQHKMPSGLCMMVLACRSIAYNDRDDLALRDTLKKIQRLIDDTRFGDAKWECKIPTTPQDDLFSKYDEDLKGKFLDDLDSFLRDAQKAAEEKNRYKSSLLWRKHFGERFPIGKDIDEPFLI
jgi:hypothetical protein